MSDYENLPEPVLKFYAELLELFIKFNFENPNVQTELRTLKTELARRQNMP